jgi:DNA polymerase-4
MCPDIEIKTPDPEKYRFINMQLTKLLLRHTPHVQVQSIDEMIVRMDNTPYATGIPNTEILPAMITLGKTIKKRIAEEIGDCITVSIGIAPNAFLAKTASNLEKPDGLKAITKENIHTVLAGLQLTDLCGIKRGNATRLLLAGITTPLAMYETTCGQLERAFRSVNGRYWWMWLHGYEMGSLYAEHSDAQKSYGQSCALTRQVDPTDAYTRQVLYQLVAKMGIRLRKDACRAQGIMAGCAYTDRTYWQKRTKLQHPVYATEDLFSYVCCLLEKAPKKRIHTVCVGVYDVVPDLYVQMTLDDREIQKRARTVAIDHIAERFGPNSITTALAMQAEQKILDRIAFGKGGLHY